jgi:ribosome biogenesis GTPase
VLVGHSGVGKSTLVNRLVPDALRAVGVVSAIGKGRHTSTSAVALRLPPVGRSRTDPGWAIDTPGIRSFGLAHVSAESLLHGFPDLVEGTLEDRPNCGHTAGDVDCRLDAWVAEGNADPRRLASYRRLLASRAGDLDHHQQPEDPTRGHQQPEDLTSGHQQPEDLTSGHQQPEDLARGRGHAEDGDELVAPPPPG